MATPQQDAESLRKAMKGIGTDEETIIRIVANRTNQHRQQIKIYYAQTYNRDLIADLKSEISGKFKDVVLALFDDPFVNDARELREAMKGAGTNEETVIEIICTRPNWYLRNIIAAYKNVYCRDLVSDVKSDFSGYCKDVLVSLLSCSRSENTIPTQQMVENYAEQLRQGGIERLGTDEKVFIDILTKCSPQELYAIANCYQQKTGESLMASIEKEFSGNVKKSLQTIIYASFSPYEYFAKRVYEAVHGAGTKDKQLMRILITRDEVDMPQIKECYKQLYGRDMVSDIKSDLSGDYKKIMIELCDH